MDLEPSNVFEELGVGCRELSHPRITTGQALVRKERIATERLSLGCISKRVERASISKALVDDIKDEMEAHRGSRGF